MFEKYYRAVEYLESLSNIASLEYMQARFRNEFYLKRTRELVKRLKINLNQFKFVHVAGTSGKGSVVAMVHGMLNAAGKQVGSFYSPHPTTSIERIRVGDKYISPNDFVELMEKIKPVINEMYLKSKYRQPSYFEIFLAMALIYFQTKKCEYVVLETGCGGEFDATNIIRKPLVAAITNIGYDHMQLLGNSLDKIAKTKAGIIKPGCVCVTSEKRDKLLKIFEDAGRKKKVKLVVVNEALGGTERNRELALKIGEILGIGKRKVSKTFLSCRFEMIQKNPQVILDGAHNCDKLKSTFVNLKKLEFNRIYLIMALNENKEIRKIFKMAGKELVSFKKGVEIYLTRHLVTERTCADLKMMYTLLPSALKRNICIYIDPWQALDKALKKAKQKDLILITGSFYLAGELRKKWVSEEKILRNNL